MNIKIIDYQTSYQPYFEKFNKAWLEAFFYVEPIDEWVLANPEEAILKEGGCILFARHQEEIIGTVALKAAGPKVFEMTKMAVDKDSQGLGAGKLLCRAAIERAGKLGARKLLLYSHTSLSAAIQIYSNFGFQEILLKKGKYKRADIMMELTLTSPEA